jgi:hypothetical protein
LRYQLSAPPRTSFANVSVYAAIPLRTAMRAVPQEHKGTGHAVLIADQVWTVGASPVYQ